MIGTHFKCFRNILVCAGCFTQALGIVLELKPNVAMLSPEGVVKYSSRRWRRDFGHLKVAFDISLVTTAAILSFINSVDKLNEVLEIIMRF